MTATRPTKEERRNQGQTPATPQPAEGMAATVCLWSDRHAATIIHVSPSGRVIRVQQDKATRTDANGMSENQEYTYKRNPLGHVRTFSLRKNGRWVERGHSTVGGVVCAIGHRGEYYDYAF